MSRIQVGYVASKRFTVTILALILGCSAGVKSNDGESRASGHNATVDCSVPNPPLACAACNNDSTCANCIDSGDQSGQACTDYCAANPDSTLCVKPEDCVDANGKCDNQKPGCYCLTDGSGGAGSGEGGADSSSDSSSDSSADDSSADSGGDTSSDDSSTDSGGDTSTDDSSADSGGDTSGDTSADSGGDTSDDSGGGEFLRPPHVSRGYAAWLRLVHHR